jgi:hypothetical protein
MRRESYGTGVARGLIVAQPGSGVKTVRWVERYEIPKTRDWKVYHSVSRSVYKAIATSKAIAIITGTMI